MCAKDAQIDQMAPKYMYKNWRHFAFLKGHERLLPCLVKQIIIIKPIMYCQFDIQEHIQWNWNTKNFYQNTKKFYQDNALENIVCKMAAILCRPQCLNPSMNF